MKIENSSINIKINNNKIIYKEKGKILINHNTQQINSKKESNEDKKINKLTETLNQLVSKVIKLKAEKEHYEKTIRRAINVLRRKGAKTVSEIDQENNAQANAVPNNDNKASSDGLHSKEINDNETIEKATNRNDNKANSNEINSKETNNAEIIDKVINTNYNNNKLDEKQEEKDTANVNIKNKNDSKQSVDYSAASITFNEEDMSKKDDEVEKSFVGKTLDELEDMLKKYESDSEANIDKLQKLIKNMKAEILELKDRKDKNKYVSKNKNKGLDLLV